MSLQSYGEAKRAQGTASILAIATANPVNYYNQSEFADFYFRITKSDHMTDLKDKLKRICEKSGIRKRHMYLTEEILKNNPNITSDKFEPSLSTRQEMMAREVPLLGVEAARKALKEWNRPVSKITHLVFATSSGAESPSADCFLAKRLGLNASVSRHFVFQQGCFSASAALRLSKDLAENNDGTRVLVVCSESTANWFSAPSHSRLGMLVGHAIFADGAAAAVIGAFAPASHGLRSLVSSFASTTTTTSERPLYHMISAVQTLVPDSEDVMYGRLVESGIVYALSPKIPHYVSSKIEEILKEALEPFSKGESNNFDWNSLFYAVHPGGRAILDKVEERLGLGPDKLWASRHVLAEYGNMWGPSVLFVLDELRKKANADHMATTGDGFDWGVSVSFGPGFTVETMVLRSVTLE